LRRKVSLLIIAAFLATMVTINHGCSRSEESEYDDSAEDFNLDLNNPNLKQRLGDDDGYAFAVLYGADIHGSLETCG